MTKTLEEARSWVGEVLGQELPDGVQPFVLPDHLSLAAVAAAVPAGHRLWVGAQDAHWAEDGAHTGSVSMRMVRAAGARLVEIGHAERRRAGETDRQVAAKVRGAIDAGLTPLLCVGEPRAVHEAGRAAACVEAQLRLTLTGLPAESVASVMVAYEPTWSIGEQGVPADPATVAQVATHVRAVLTDLAEGPAVGPVLYGGGVDAENADLLMALAGTDGLFVGRAAWTASGFLRLLGRCARLAVPHGGPAATATPPVLTSPRS